MSGLRDCARLVLVIKVSENVEKTVDEMRESGFIDFAELIYTVKAFYAKVGGFWIRNKRRVDLIEPGHHIVAVI